MSIDFNYDVINTICQEMVFNIVFIVMSVIPGVKRVAEKDIDFHCGVINNRGQTSG